MLPYTPALATPAGATLFVNHLTRPAVCQYRISPPAPYAPYAPSHSGEFVPGTRAKQQSVHLVQRKGPTGRARLGDPLQEDGDVSLGAFPSLVTAPAPLLGG